MNLENETDFEAGWTMGFQPDGRELLVIAVKGTFIIPENNEEPLLAEEQAPLTEADEFTGEPGFSATLYESDYAHHKPACDVLLNGSAYAPNGEPVEHVTVGLRMGSIEKSFDVVGDRIWDKVLLSVVPSCPQPFTQLRIGYDQAFGGVDVSEKNPDKQKTYLKNPVGVGYYPLTKTKALIGKPLPNTAEIGYPIESTTGSYNPMAFGSMGRNFKSRIPFTGTYDQKWLDYRAPFFPDDFDYRYFQSAPVDQQIPYPNGGEEVTLMNLTPKGITRFKLPENISMPVLFLPRKYKETQQDAVLDTLIIEPDQRRFMLTWRTSFLLRRNCFELQKVVVGKTLKAHRSEVRRSTKTHYANLAELVEARKGK